MSSALTIAIYQRLVGLETLTGDYAALQTRLASLLATDADTDMPSVCKGNTSDVTTYPTITFRENAGLADKRFSVVGAAGVCVADQPVYDFEVWGKTRLATEVSDIDDCLVRLLDCRWGAPPLPLPDGVMDAALTFVTPTSLYDETRHAWFLLRRIQFKSRVFSAAL